MPEYQDLNLNMDLIFDKHVFSGCYDFWRSARFGGFRDKFDQPHVLFHSNDRGIYLIISHLENSPKHPYIVSPADMPSLCFGQFLCRNVARMQQIRLSWGKK